MKNKVILVIIIVIAILIILIPFKLLGHKVYDNVSLNKTTNVENNNMTSTIEAIVVKVNEKNLLVMDLKDLNELYSIGLTNFKNIEFKKGQKILIYFNGDIMESYPAQLGKIGKIEIIEEKSNIEIPDSILRFCYSSSDNIQVDINELTNSSISLIITDTNEIPYEYAHSYKINKQVKNENYTGVGQKIGEDTDNFIAGYTRNRTRIYMERSN